jgi:hypothetical protein
LNIAAPDGTALRDVIRSERNEGAP